MAKKQTLTPSGVKAAVKKCEALRRHTKRPVDISLSEYVKKAHGISMEAAYSDLKIQPQYDSIQNILNLPDSNYRWLIPEIYRDALRLGLRKAPIYPSLIIQEQSVSQLSVKMPAINMSEATPKKVGVAETITTGSVSFDQKDVKIYKYGRGFKVPYEVIQYVPLNLLSIYMQDFGVKMAMGLDNMALSTIMNGDQVSGVDSIATVGIETPNTLAYRDFLRVWVRMGRLGKNPANIIAGEEMAIELLDLFTNSRTLGTPRTNVNVRTPIPTNANVWVHGAVPDDIAIIVDPSSALIKLNAQPLLLENEKIVSNQVQAVYATFTTGFATVYRDSRIAIDLTKDFAVDGFPTWMDPSSQEQVSFD